MVTHDGSGPGPRILCVADERPWPERSGYRIRLANVLRGLGRAGTVDLLVLHGKSGDPSVPTEVPEGEPVRTVRSAPLPAPVRRRTGWVPWLRGDLPRRVAWRDWSTARAAFAGTIAEGYDLVWWSHLDTWMVLGGTSAVPAIVDLDNLEDQMLVGRRDAHRGGSVRARLRRVVVARLDAIDARRWRHWQDRAATRTTAAVVCAERDRTLVAGPRVRVVPNGFTTPTIPAGHPHRAVPDAGGVIAFVGLQTYEPNVDASRFLVEEVLPRLRAARPALEVHIVGRSGAEVAGLAGPGVRVLGEVDDLPGVLAAADLIAVPVRFGGGTRIKVLEAMAHRIPIVTTNLGCSGLGLRAGVEVEIADDSDSFAAACLRLLGSADLRIARAEAAARTHAARFEWSAIADDVAALARAATAVSA